MCSNCGMHSRLSTKFNQQNFQQTRQKNKIVPRQSVNFSYKYSAEYMGDSARFFFAITNINRQQCGSRKIISDTLAVLLLCQLCKLNCVGHSISWCLSSNEYIYGIMSCCFKMIMHFLDAPNYTLFPHEPHGIKICVPPKWWWWMFNDGRWSSAKIAVNVWGILLKFAKNTRNYGELFNVEPICHQTSYVEKLLLAMPTLAQTMSV